MKVCAYVCIPYSFYSDSHICDTNDVKLSTTDCIIITSLVIFQKKNQILSPSWSNKSRDIILELLVDWCALLVIIYSLLLFFLYILLFQFMRHLMCACVCVPYVNLLYIRVCCIYHQHCHVDCWCLPQLVFVVRLFASASITLHCEVLGVCQEQKGNMSMAFFLSSSSSSSSLSLFSFHST